ncbi:putative exopolyphosphatase [Penicillium brasilianum]|uniref:Putative exopolyphosphatase n=1 Tax=Penicillium brasilianum TaxID=104259 RepID=A0A1S9RJC5_PENBI|nr:putative exopolyphosphatase [Penicillium brasilianum]
MTLLQFLRQSRQLHLQFLAGALPEPPIYVLGNPSADLDSIISAIVYSYCANNRLPPTTPRPHIPLLNLSNVPAGPELYRLRPEFVEALWLSTSFPPLRPEEQFDNNSQSAGKLLGEHLVTVADFARSLKELHTTKKIEADAVMVDWNAMQHRVEGKPGYGSVSGLEEVTFRTVGCIDHHADEHFVPGSEDLPSEQPLIIQPGPGSCSSLITSELQKRGLWTASQDASSTAQIAQVAKLALAPILIDTSNLTAKGKVKDVDIQSLEFLRELVCGATSESAVEWNMDSFYERIQDAKKNSLNLLTLEEILDRDFKDWTETARSSGQTVKLGFCSSVKPIRWIIEKAGGSQEFMDTVRRFAQMEGKKLDMVVVMTSFTSAEEQHTRELFICATQESGLTVDGIKKFIEESSSLGLVEWTSLDGESVDLVDADIRASLNGTSEVWRHLWVQTNATASRKQVAPMLRDAVAKL